MMNLEKLSPAPWTHIASAGAPIIQFPGGYVARLCSQESKAFGMTSLAPNAESAEENAKFITLARNAFDVMMRRGWYSVPYSVDAKTWIAMNLYCVQIERGGNTGTYFVSDNPFSCLVEADKWMKEQESKK